MTTRQVCLFCRTSCACGSDFVQEFITYLETININVKKHENNFRPEDFHCCEECGSLLETISRQVQKLGQDLLEIRRITLENLHRNELINKDDEVLEKLRRQSVSSFNPCISLRKDLTIKQGIQPHHSSIPDTILRPTQIEIDEAGSDVDIDHVSVKIEDDCDVDMDDEMENQLDGEPEVELDEFMLSPESEQDVDPLQSDADYDPLQVDEDDGHSSPDESFNKIAKVVQPVEPPARKGYRLLAPKPQPIQPLPNFTSSPHNESNPNVTVRQTRQGIKVISPDKSELINTSEKLEIFQRVICSGVEVIQMDESVFKCGTCNCTTDSLLSMAVHVQTEHDSLIRLPIKCTPPALSKSQMYLTLSASQSTQDFSSTSQNVKDSSLAQPEVGITKDSYSSPVPQSNPEKKCDRCDLSFKTETSLIDHKAEVHYNGVFVCDSCKLGFVEKYNHDYHVRKCNGSPSEDVGTSEQIVIADSIGTYLGVEIKEIVTDKDKRKCEYECGLCNEKRKSRSYLLIHIRLKHTENGPLKCMNAACGFAFASQAALNDHIRKYDHQWRNMCEFCPSVLSTSRELELHVLRVHQNLTRFSCSHCRKGFYRRASCHKHETRCPKKAKPKKPKALDPDAQTKLIESARESIRGQEIISSRCKYCSKTIFGSSPTFSLHEKICQLEVSSVGVQSASKWRESLVPVGTGAWVLSNVEIIKSQIIKDPDVTMYKCGGCNETFKERDDAEKHVREANHSN